MPPHGIGGLSWAEIFALLGIAGVVWGAGRSAAKGARGFVDRLKQEVAEPIQREMANLSEKIESISGEHKTFDRRLDKHDMKLVKHEAEIGNLYRNAGLKREDEKDED